MQKAVGFSPTSTTQGRFFRAAASIRVQLMCNLSSEKVRLLSSIRVRLLIKCGFYTRLYGILKWQHKHDVVDLTYTSVWWQNCSLPVARAFLQPVSDTCTQLHRKRGMSERFSFEQEPHPETEYFQPNQHSMSLVIEMPHWDKTPRNSWKYHHPLALCCRETRSVITNAKKLAGGKAN